MKYYKAKVDEDSFKDSFLHLYKLCYGFRKDLDEQWYNWFNLECPTGLNNIYVIKDEVNNQLISAYGFLPYIVDYKGKEVKASLANNVMVHPDYQGQGLFVKISKYAIENEINSGCKWILGIPNKNAIRGHLKVGWQQLTSIPFYEHSINNNSKLFFPPEVQEIRSFTSEHQVHILPSGYDFHVKKDASFLNWRTFKRPYKQYRAFGIKGENDQIDGYIILKNFSREDGLKVTHIVDFSFKRQKNLEDLIIYAIAYAQQSKSIKLNIWGRSSDLNLSALKKFGFSPVKEENMLIVYSEDFREIESTQNWHLTLIDNDVY